MTAELNTVSAEGSSIEQGIDASAVAADRAQERMEEQPPERLDEPLEDINAVGARERAFPLKALLVFGGLALLLLVGLVFVLKTRAPAMFSVEQKRREDLPAASPTTTAPKLQLPIGTEATEPDRSAQSSLSGIRPAAAAAAPSAGGFPNVLAGAGGGSVQVPAIIGTNRPASEPCPVSVLLDKSTGKPVRGDNGVLMVDCRGNVTPTRASTQPGMGAGANTGVPEVYAAPLTADRFFGDVLLSAGATKPEGAASGPQAKSATPQLPPAPLTNALAPLLERLTQQAQGGAGPSPGAAAAAQQIAAQQLAAQQSASGGSQSQGSGGAVTTQGAVGNMLGGSRTDKAVAVKAMDENLTIPKGVQIDCVLTTRAVTEISGFASCMVSANVYSANGRVLLIERMSEVQGEYAASGTQPGQRAIHVVWTRIRKAGGITIDIGSPATDGLGAAGLPATVDNRWLERVGGAYLLSFIKDVIAYKTATDAATGSSVAAGTAFNNTVQQTNSMAEKVLNSTINIKPTLYANQGDRVAIYVARDLDFSTVYAVRHAGQP